MASGYKATANGKGPRHRVITLAIGTAPRHRVIKPSAQRHRRPAIGFKPTPAALTPRHWVLQPPPNYGAQALGACQRHRQGHPRHGFQANARGDSSTALGEFAEANAKSSMALGTPQSQRHCFHSVGCRRGDNPRRSMPPARQEPNTSGKIQFQHWSVHHQANGDGSFRN